MGRNQDDKREKAYVTEEDGGAVEQTETLLAKAHSEAAYEGSAPGIYTDAVRLVFERNRKRVSMYYCPNTSCGRTFWDASEGYECPACGSLGIISEYRYRHLAGNPGEHNIVGYVDNLGRLVCSSCILNYGVQGEVGLIVYDDTEPFCFEQCAICKEPLGQYTS
jgi:rubrerythrin